MDKQIATNVTWHQGAVSRQEREWNLGQKGVTLWMTGLPSSGKSTIAVALEQALLQRGKHSYRLDGDNVRHGLNKNLGFSARSSAEKPRFFADAGLIAITSFISPYRADRELVRKLHEADGIEFLEVFVDCPLEEAEQRDPKGLYRKARAGEIKGFTGIDDPYEAPERPELHLRTHKQTVAVSVRDLVDLLEKRGVLKEREK